MLFKKLDALKEKLSAWAVARSRGAHATIWLFGLSFAEASFFPIPPDILLMGILVVNANKWWYHAGIASIGSVLGGILGYIIGSVFFNLFGDAIIDFYHLETQLQYVGQLFESNAFWSIFIAAFTPIPYKVFTIASGLFNINFIVFIVASLTGRSLRFYFVAYMVRLFGKHMSYFLYKYFNWLTIILVVIVSGAVLFKLM